MEPRTALNCLLLSCLVACSSADSPPGSSTGTAASVRPGSTPATAQDPSPAAGVEVDAGGLRFRAPTAWKLETPSSPMRKLQATLPRQGSDPEDASLVVYYFGAGQGGTKEQNIERWAGQFEQPDGRASIDVLKRSSRRVGELPVEEVDVSGDFVAETQPGSGVRVHKTGWRLLAAIVDAPDGPYFVKLTGPQATVTHWEGAFRALMTSVQKAR